MRISDWSSDVCSSDLVDEGSQHVLGAVEALQGVVDPDAHDRHQQHTLGSAEVAAIDPGQQHQGPHPPGDRKSVVSGQSVSVRVDLGGRRLIQTKNISTQNISTNIDISIKLK